MPTELYHVSETSGIGEFEPRLPPSPDPGVPRPVVWAVDDRRLHNYLLPRDCPRVAFSAAEGSDDRDVRALMGAPGVASRAVVAIESGWLARVREAVLYLYRMAPEGFEVADAVAGYWTCGRRVSPIGVTEVRDCAAAIAERGVELRVVASLWPLHDAVTRSSLHFSCIRMRNAAGRSTGARGGAALE